MNEYRFIITVHHVGMSPSEYTKERTFDKFIYAKTEHGAWIRLVSEIQSDLKRFESVYQINLIEVI